jgi:hypothetical protein
MIKSRKRKTGLRVIGTAEIDRLVVCGSGFPDVWETRSIWLC